MDARRIAATLPHLHRAGLAKGDPVPLPIVPAAIYNLPGDPAGFAQYGRFDNATWEGVEALLSHLEQAPAVAFPSGMAAISAAFMAVLASGDRLLLPSDGYYTSRMFADRYLARLGVTVETRPTRRFAEGGFAGFKAIFLETPSNPGLDLCDIEAVCREAAAEGALVIADNTTMTPYGQRPLDLGANIVVAADTKAPNGHSDALFGHAASRNEDLVRALREWRKLSGAIPGPFDAWLVHRGLETLDVRFDRMCSSATLIAQRLAEHPKVVATVHPGLPSHPDRALAGRQMLRDGFLIGLELASAEDAERFIDFCPLLQPATSFGGVHSSAERRARWGDAVAPGFIRLSVGCEPVEELWSAIDQSLRALGAQS